MDKIAEMLTKIRNAQKAGHKEVLIKPSKFKFALAKVLQEEGYVEKVSPKKDGKGAIIFLKYNSSGQIGKTPAIKGIKKVSKSGQRIYVKSKDIKRVKNDYGVAILSTSKGVMTGRQAKEEGLGGEYICEIW